MIASANSRGAFSGAVVDTGELDRAKLAIGVGRRRRFLNLLAAPERCRRRSTTSVVGTTTRGHFIFDAVCRRQNVARYPVECRGPALPASCIFATASRGTGPAAAALAVRGNSFSCGAPGYASPRCRTSALAGPLAALQSLPDRRRVSGAHRHIAGEPLRDGWRAASCHRRSPTPVMAGEKAAL